MENKYYKNSTSVEKSINTQLKTDKNISAVAKGSTQKKKGEFRKMMDAFFAEDIVDIREYALEQVIIPKIKEAILDVMNTLLLGKSSHGRKSTASKVSYRSFYEQPDSRGYSLPKRGSYDYDDVIFDTRGDAEKVLSTMEEIIATYQIVSVMDFYELADVRQAISNTDNKYGWTNLQSAYVERTREGYIIRLPRPMPID